MNLKPISDQVIVITGATSGIGLATARLAAKRGAKLVLVARNEEALEAIKRELSTLTSVEVVAADVANEEELNAAAVTALNEFGRIDSWINNAGISIFGYNEQVSREDQRRVFETNFWGVVNGSIIAAKHLREKGGALINLGSELSDSYAPLQGIYTASKHAVKAFTESLRSELDHDKAPVSVTIIKPAAIASLFVEHAKNYMEVEAKLPAPLYAPELVALAILSAAEYPQREVFVGGAAKAMSVVSKFAPNWINRRIEQSMFAQQRSDKLEQHPNQNSLYSPGSDLRVRGQTAARVRESCPYTKAALRPQRTVAMAAGVAALVLWGASKSRSTH